jgi:3-oxoacyl-[acyl-carrier-protein] synthase-3
MNAAYINEAYGYLPGPPISNDQMDDVLGRLDNNNTKLRARILKNNYALDPQTGKPNESSAEMAAKAVRGLCARSALPLEEIEVLACATSMTEQLTPGHASMVHGELKNPPCEILTAHGVCCSGMSALKYATMAVWSGQARNAVVSAVERTSAFLRAEHFRAELDARQGESDPYVGFNQEFLRWMLSDGAGAALVQDRPRGAALRVEWMELFSFANELPTCMYMGAKPKADGGLVGWRDGGPLEEVIRQGYFNLHQDVRLLGEHMIPVTISRTLAEIRRKRSFDSSEIDWVLPHYSSEFFREKAFNELERIGFPIPYRKWCSNLTERGNTGCASIFIMLDDFLRSGKLKRGDGVLLLVPESGRFSCSWAFLRAV